MCCAALGVRIVRGCVLFTLLDFVMAMRFVDEHATDGTGACAHDQAGRTTYLRAYDGSCYRAAGNELGLGVVMVIVAMRLRDGVFMGLLRMDGKRQREDGCGYGGCC